MERVLMHSANLAWMTQNRSLGVGKIPIIMIIFKFLNTSEKMTCFFGWHDFSKFPPARIRLFTTKPNYSPSLSLQLKRGCFWYFLLENCHTFFFLLKKIFHIEPHSLLERLLREKKWSTNFPNSNHENTMLVMKNN